MLRGQGESCACAKSMAAWRRAGEREWGKAGAREVRADGGGFSIADERRLRPLGDRMLRRTGWLIRVGSATI